MATASSKNAHKPAPVFIGYAQEDHKMLKRLEKNLDTLKQLGLITVVHMGVIKPGQEFDTQIKKWLRDARIILFLLSADLIASVYYNEVEVKWALERHDRGECVVIPVILRDCQWQDTVLSKLEALPKYGKPIASYKPHDGGYVNVISGLKNVIYGLVDLEELGNDSRPLEVQKSSSKRNLWNIPEDNPFFTGREEIIEQLHTKLGESRLVALTQSTSDSGFGGIGKTQVAVKYANLHLHDYSSGIWIQADSLPVFNASLAEIIRRYPEEFTSDRVDFYQKMRKWLANNKDWLLILDNIYSFEVVKNLVPDEIKHNGYVVFTTLEQAAGHFPNVKVGKLGEEEGTLFLLQRAYGFNDRSELPANLTTGVIYEQAKKVVQVLDCHPLALDQAGTYFFQYKSGWEGLLEIYKHERELILKNRVNFPRRTQKLHEDHLSVTLTLTLLLDEVAKINPAVNELLKFCAAFPSGKIEEQIIIDGASFLGRTLMPVARQQGLRDKAFGELIRRTLINREPRATTTQVTMHRVVQTVILDKMGYDERYLWAKRTLQAIMHGDKTPGYSNTEKIYTNELETPVINNDPSRKALYLIILAEFYRFLAKYDDAREKLDEANKIREEALNRQQSDEYRRMWQICQVIILNNLAKLYYGEGDFRSARRECEKAISFCKTIFRLEHFLSVDCSHNLATIYTEQGEYRSAQRQFRLSLRIREKIFSSGDLDIAQSHNDMGDWYRIMGKYSQAEQAYQTALRLRMAVLGENHPDIAQSLSNLAELERIRGNFKIAKEKHIRALEMQEKILMDDHPAIAQSLIYIAELERIGGDNAGAEQRINKAMKIWEGRKPASGVDYANDHPDMALCWKILGEIELSRGEKESAREYFDRAYRLRVRKYGNEHILVASSLNKRGNLSLRSGNNNQAKKDFKEAEKDFKEAENDFKEALRIRKVRLGPIHPLVASSHRFLARLYRIQSNSSQARRSLKRAIGIYRKTDLSGSPDMASCYAFLAHLYEEANNFKRADYYYKEAVRIYEQKLGSTHELTRSIKESGERVFAQIGTRRRSSRD